MGQYKRKINDKAAYSINFDAEENTIAFMPLMSSSFKMGECKEYISQLSEPKIRSIAQAEYYYFSGQPEEACGQAKLFFGDRDLNIRLSAYTICGFSNLSLGRIQLARQALLHVFEMLENGFFEKGSSQEVAIKAFTATVTTVLLHLDTGKVTLTQNEIRCLPAGLRVFACYLMAHRAYLNEDYERAVGIVQTALTLISGMYPIPEIYLNLAAAMSLMSLKRAEEATEYFYAAWKIARPDNLIEAFGEHHGLLQGLIEKCLRSEYPEQYEKIINITYSFSAGWREIHNPRAGDNIADNLTTMEFSIAMLASKGWSNKEIAQHMAMSVNSVKHYTSIIYQKLGITGRKQLSKYMLR